jgi:hypothetical protein
MRKLGATTRKEALARFDALTQVRAGRKPSPP